MSNKKEYEIMEKIRELSFKEYSFQRAASIVKYQITNLEKQLQNIRWKEEEEIKEKFYKNNKGDGVVNKIDSMLNLSEEEKNEFK